MAEKGSASMERDSSRNMSAETIETVGGGAFTFQPFAARMSRSLEFLVHSYVGYSLVLCRRDRQDFLTRFPRHRAELEPLLAAADVAIAAYETIESIAPKRRRAAWRRLPAKQRHEVRSNFIQGSRLFAEFMGDVRNLRAEARERVKQGGPEAVAGRRCADWAKSILRDPVIAARVFDEGARRLVAELSKPDEAANASIRPLRPSARMN